MDQEFNQELSQSSQTQTQSEESANALNVQDVQNTESETTSAPETAKDNQEPQTMQEVLDQYGTTSRLRKGEIKTGTVIGENDAGYLVDVGFKCEGVLPKHEWTHRSLIETEGTPKSGDKIEVEIVSVRDGEEAQLTLSRWRHEFDRRWSAFEEKLNGSDVIQVRGVEKVKGGLMVDCCGLEGFMPISHLTLIGRGANPANFVGQNITVKVLDKDKRKRRLVFSRKALLEQAENERKAKFYDNVHEGDIVEGEVSSITDFGIFVTVGTMDGLVHITEITWKRNVKLRDMFKKGDKVKVKVVGIDKEKDRISLSIKQVEGDPWDTITERLHKGDKIKGNITNLTEFGAFVEIEPGIEGLVHVGDITWEKIKKPRDVFKRGQEVEAIVLDIDTEKRRISLGCKQLNDPWNEIEKRYTAGQDVNVKVVRLADFGAFAEVEPGVEALIHISQISRKRIEKPGDVLKEGQEVTAKILEVNPEQRRMRLSMSALEEIKPEEQIELSEQDTSRTDFPHFEQKTRFSPENELKSEKPRRERSGKTERAEKTERPERPEKFERAEKREKKNKLSRARILREAADYGDDSDEAIEYNPFAEAFRDMDWNE